MPKQIESKMERIERELRLPCELNEQLKLLAEHDDRSMNSYIIRVLQAHVEQVQSPVPVARTVGAPE